MQNLFSDSTCSALRGCDSSLSCRALSPVHSTKSMLSARLAWIQEKVALIRAKGESQSVVSAP